MSDAIAGAQTDIDQAISDQNNTISQQLDDLDRTRKDLQDSANQSGKNIDECISQEETSVNNLDRSALLACGSCPDLQVLLGRVQQIDDLGPILGQIVNICRKKECTLTDVKNCVKAGLADVRDRADSAKQKTVVDIANIVDAATKCTNAAGSDLSDKIKKIQDTLVACVSCFLNTN